MPELMEEMFGNFFIRAQLVEPLYSPELTQPKLQLPFEPNRVWNFTGGPHSAWGENGALAALDFAPPSGESGCVESNQWVTAMAPGVIVRAGNGAVIEDLDDDNTENTGWNIFYMHIATEGRVAVGTRLETGDKIGHPSCEGGVSTGTHTHIARKYNGEWILAGGPMPFDLSGYIAHDGAEPYEGTLTKGDITITRNANAAGNPTSPFHKSSVHTQGFQKMRDSLRRKPKICFTLIGFFLIMGMLAGCSESPGTVIQIPVVKSTAPTSAAEVLASPYPTRPIYSPGTLIDYTAQNGDNLPALANHFNTSVDEILDANPLLPEGITTLQEGYPLKIPVYYEALWGSQFQIIPDALFINGPAQISFDTVDFVNASPGWLRNYTVFAGGQNRTGGEVIDYVAMNFSISPRLLLAIAEYQAGALSKPILAEEDSAFPLGYKGLFNQGFYMQLVWAANQLNNGYYLWRTGRMESIIRTDGTLEIPDPWQNAASVGIKNYFALILSSPEYMQAVGDKGLFATYTQFFGDPWQNVQPHIPGNLQQPDLVLPFAIGKKWAFTGGPHSVWGTTEPYAALDFAPATALGGCSPTDEVVVAVASGLIARTGDAIAILDLDGDGDERTGWVIFYLHLRNADMVRTGTLVKTGDIIGYPSCEGGSATGTHVHIARKYNGEWIDADSAVPFTLDGWVAENGSAPYLGTLNRLGHVVTASDVGAGKSAITAGMK